MILSPVLSRLIAGTSVTLAILLAGCASSDSKTPEGERPAVATIPSKGGGLVRESQPSDAQSKTDSAENATLVLPTSGRIHSVNPGLQFVVIDYTLGGVPALQSLLPVYRGDQKVGQVRLTGPERNGFVAADVVEGILQTDDEVRVH
jgi:hypothetical protein